MNIKKYNKRNAFMYKINYKKPVYDWWWHSLLGRNRKTGKLEPFFIEYFILLSGKNKNPITFPDAKYPYGFAMIMAGKWGENKSQIHNYYPLDDLYASNKQMEVSIGKNTADEYKLQGEVYLSKEKVKNNPHYLSDEGVMKWDLKINKKIPYSVGYGTSAFFRKLNMWQMFWHVNGLYTEYEGKIEYNGQIYDVEPESCAGYQDKNWGKDYTNPWIWLNCNRFFNDKGIQEKDVYLDIGGGNPSILGISLGEKILCAFYYKGKIYDFNFTKLFYQKQLWHCKEDEKFIYWNIEASNKEHSISVNFKCEKKGMLKINYYNPKGEHNHKNLFNGGYAEGTVHFYKKTKGSKKLIQKLYGEMGGCEYGRF